MRKVMSKRDAILQHYMSIRPSNFTSMPSELYGPPLGDSRGKQLAIGGSSTVTLEMDPKTGKLVAVKHIRFGSERSIFIREVETLARLNHPNVLRILGWAFPDSSHCAQILTEYAPNGSIDQLFGDSRQGRAHRFSSPTHIGIIICGIVLGMRYVHLSGVIHGDLKPSNILLNEKGHPLICDFGSSRLQSDDATPSHEFGTVQYAAPEQFFEDSVATPSIDVFTFGLILYELLTGSPVFSPLEPPFEVIRRFRRWDLPVLPAACGSLMQDLIRRCWCVEPEGRPPFHQILWEFRCCNFDILPNIASSEVRDFCEAIMEWEERAGIPR
jgi:abelson tyrosine-protein kinase 1/abelson tyrosine-protein kinase 2